MAVKLTIKNLKNITKLEFEVPNPGAYLLTGSNGSGKTSLLTCLNRLGNSGAFQRGFRSSSHVSLDSHKGASIQYDINNDSVTYTYVEERWAPLPRSKSSLLTTCGYPEVKFIAADSDRVEPKKEEFAPRSVRLTDQSLRDAMNNIFGTSRFDELCYLNLTRGSGNRAYLIRQRSAKNTMYFSERNFSLGELSVLKLLLSLENITNGSLVLIDELELAVHPRAQTKLFHHLTNFASTKDLTIIFSTHSVTLIKTTERNKILFLQNNNGNITCIKGCFPTFALGQITAGEEVAPDAVIYVEDDSAKKCVEAMMSLYRKTMTPLRAQPTVLAVPLGGFRQILEFLDKSPQLLPVNTKLKVLFDADVKSESLTGYTNDNDLYMLDLFNRLNTKISYLPWTPEVGFIELISKDISQHENGLKSYFNDNRFTFPNNWRTSPAGTKGKQIRDAAKSSLFTLSVYIENLIGKSNDYVRSGLFDYFIQQTDIQNEHDVKSLIQKTVFN